MVVSDSMQTARSDQTHNFSDSGTHLYHVWFKRICFGKIIISLSFVTNLSTSTDSDVKMSDKHMAEEREGIFF